MSLSSLQLTSAASMIAATITRTISGLSPISSPQSFGSSWGYTLGSSGDTVLDGVIFKGLTIEGGVSATINIVTGTESDPTGDNPIHIATLKEVFLAVASTNADDGSETPDEGVSVDFSGEMMNAMGWAGGTAKTKVLLKYQRIAESNPVGIPTGANANLVITNLNATSKTTVYIVLAGFKA